LRFAFSGVLLAVYFGFFLACSFAPATMTQTLSGSSSVTVAMALGAALIAGSIALTGLYSVIADRT
jgi:uncharacterized membrane protein (DUF485 family)